MVRQTFPRTVKVSDRTEVTINMHLALTLQFAQESASQGNLASAHDEEFSDSTTPGHGRMAVTI